MVTKTAGNIDSLRVLFNIGQFLFYYEDIRRKAKDARLNNYENDVLRQAKVDLEKQLKLIEEIEKLKGYPNSDEI